ncbi:hypothetical protein FJZ40_00475 [Candidatus Shapirobacteria bacterium]|nr:hypothetical protein [Candidatus Shapirobacteria bacterium]
MATSLLFLFHSFLLGLAVLLTFFWVNDPSLSPYDLQLVAGLVISYFFFRLLKIKSSVAPEAIILTVVILLLVSSTGGLNSPVFFLTYFLLFGVSLFFEPAVTLTLTLSLAFFFADSLNSLNAAVQLGSFLFITPLALFFGRQYLKVLHQKGEIQILARQKEELEKKLETEEEDSLLWLCLNLKAGLTSIIDKTSSFVADMRLSPIHRESLREIHEIAKRLLRQSQKLKEKIDETSD